jgi:hypothetical protein
MVPCASKGTPTTVPAEIAEVLRRVPDGLRHWTWESNVRFKNYQPRQWHIEHEYHVQNLLWFLLAPMLPDALKEVPLRQIGGMSPRPDILIPSMRLVIEVKFLRGSQKPEDIYSGDCSGSRIVHHRGIGVGIKDRFCVGRIQAIRTALFAD